MSNETLSGLKELGCVTGGSIAGASVGTGAVVAAGTGAGATVMTTGLATLGTIVGGGMLAGIGVVVVGGGLTFYATYRGLKKLFRS